MKLLIALTILLAGCTANKATFETGNDTNYKRPATVEAGVKPPVITPCIKHKGKCKNPNFKKGHSHKKAKKNKKSKH